MAEKVNKYIRFYGHVRSFQDEKHCVAFRVDTVEDMNELTSHMLEVLVAHLDLSKTGGVSTLFCSIRVRCV